ncbi:MAG: hypothetical protein WA736_09435 [Candidatus Acidiferrum sp.]
MGTPASNRHRSTGTSTDGTTSYSYDALNRTTSVTEQDGSVLSTSYSGNCVTSTDPAGKSRKSCSDALGRLTGVWEDPAGVNYETDYSYDALDNLLSVVQAGSRPRSFVYNSLSQLTKATNPESGTVNYTYAQQKYELNTTPTHRATVPANRVKQLGPAPDGKPTTSGGGSQAATPHPIPVKPDEIKPLEP